MASPSAAHHGHGAYNGEPGCQTLGEVDKNYRNFWDPTSFWQCEQQGKKAKLCRCPQSQLFSDKLNKCVHYTEWQWTEPTEPPSRPATSQQKK